MKVEELSAMGGGSVPESLYEEFSEFPDTENGAEDRGEDISEEEDKKEEVVSPETQENGKSSEEKEDEEVLSEESDLKGEEDSEEAEPDSAEPFIKLVSAEMGEEPDSELMESIKSLGVGSVEQIAKYLKGYIEKKSVPVYASADIEELDKAVRAGADLRELLSRSYSSPDYKRLDITDRDSRQILIEDYLRSATKLTDAKIQREIERIEALIEAEKDTEKDLEENDNALEEIREMRDYMASEEDRRKKEYIESEKAAAAKRAEDVKKAIEKHKENIMSSKSLAGFEVSAADKKGMIEYMFSFDGNGLSQYQRELKENPSMAYDLGFHAYKKLSKSKFLDKLKTEASQNLVKTLRRHQDKNAKPAGSPSEIHKTSKVEQEDIGDFFI